MVVVVVAAAVVIMSAAARTFPGEGRRLRGEGRRYALPARHRVRVQHKARAREDTAQLRARRVKGRNEARL
jgi:hypothetical protein